MNNGTEFHCWIWRLFNNLETGLKKRITSENSPAFYSLINKYLDTLLNCEISELCKCWPLIIINIDLCGIQDRFNSLLFKNLITWNKHWSKEQKMLLTLLYILLRSRYIGDLPQISIWDRNLKIIYFFFWPHTHIKTMGHRYLHSVNLKTLTGNVSFPWKLKFKYFGNWNTFSVCCL